MHLALLSAYLSKFKTHDAIKKHIKQHITKTFRTKSFRKEALKFISIGMSEELYWKDQSEVLENQVRNTPSSDFLLKSFEGTVYTPPMNTGIGLEATPAA